ncbi:hypothetical protein [Cellulosimicrobium sp. Marseille-Q4280]|uniref:hypothetical protein n=1 Tax=Cellulosimicrobium sp. Marseille-Q4280 TaxID=2937992 RepID=UPI00203E7359|nr:hypothetical protein [Cellulosimicrobium sp. Marseille-Q4280]
MNLNVDLGELLRRKKSDPDAPPAGQGAGKTAAQAVKIDQPRVDLLPDKYRQRAAERTVRQGAIATAAGAGVLVAGVWGAMLVTNGSAQSQLDDAKIVEQALSADMAVYSPVTNLATQTQSLTDTIQDQASKSVDHDSVLDRFLAAAAGRIDVASVQVDTSSGDACVSTDPFAAETDRVGCITFSGTPADVPGLLAALSSDDWFTDPYVPSVGADASVSGTVGLTELVRTQATDAAPEADPAADTEGADTATDPQTTQPLEINLGEQDGAQG